MDTTIAQLRSVLEQRSVGIPDEQFALRSLWRVDHRTQPTPQERFMVYSFVMAQTVRQGCCYADFGSVNIGPWSDALIGRDTRNIKGSRIEEEIAILDAAYGVLPRSPQQVRVVDGQLDQKAMQRAQIIVDEALAQLKQKGGRKVAQVGVLGNLVHHLKRADVDLTASDFDPHLLEHGILGVPVVNGDQSPRLVAEADVALVCGETLPSQTMGELVATARKHGTRLVVFAVTGCHFGEEYCRTLGMDAVICEPQPQYLFQGPSTLEIYRKQGSK